MSTDLDFIEYICEQIEGAGDIAYRKMFGEYMVYVNAKPHYILDIDNADFCREVIRILEPITAIPKPKKKKAKNI